MRASTSSRSMNDPSLLLVQIKLKKWNWNDSTHRIHAAARLAMRTREPTFSHFQSDFREDSFYSASAPGWPTE